MSLILDGLWYGLIVLFTLLLHIIQDIKISLQIIIWNITEYGAGHREGAEVIKEHFFFHCSFKLRAVLGGKHSNIEWGAWFKVWYSFGQVKTKDMMTWGTEWYTFKPLQRLSGIGNFF